MISGNDARDQFKSSEPTHCVSKAAAGSEDAITLTKAQLQKLLRALEAQEQNCSFGEKAVLTKTTSETAFVNIGYAPQAIEPSDTIATASVPTITNDLSKLPISGDDCLPNWVKRNSRDPHGTQQSNESSLAGFSQRLSNSHPELGTASSRPFSKLAQKQRQWEKERAEMQEWHPWGRPGGGAPRCQPVAAVPPRTDAQVLRVQATTAASSTGPYPSRAPSPPTLSHLPPNGGGVSPTFVRRVPPYLGSQLPFGPTYNVQEDEKDEVKKQWIQELEHQRAENHRRGVENRHASLSNGSCWPDSESLGSEKLVRPGEDCSESVWSITRGQGFRPGTDAKMSTSDEKRIRALEYQRAIQAQMQEKQERLRAEREARIREEREQERRLEEERRKLELEYQVEQRKLREKKEREEKARLLLITKMQQAAEEAEALRKARRSQRFHHLSQPDQGAQQLGNFDSGGSVDADISTSLERISSSMAGISNIASEEQTDLSTQQNFSSAQMSSQALLSVPPLQTSVPATMAPSAAVRPLRGDHSITTGNKVQREMSSQTDGSLSSICSSRCSLLSSAGTVELSPYIKNRVLTPTKVRIAQRALRFQQQRCREFGIQTDISLPCGWNHSILSDNTTQLAEEFETRSCLREFPPYTTGVRRLQHTLPMKGVHRKPAACMPSENLREPATTQRAPVTVNKSRVSSVLPAAIARSSAQKLQELQRQHFEQQSGVRRLRAVSQFSSQVVGKGGITERNRDRDPVRVAGQAPLHFEEEGLQDSAQSEEEDSTIHDSVSRPAQSPPVPALRDKILLPSPHRSEKTNVSNSSNVSSEVPAVTPSKALATQEKVPETPPASRKRWRRQEVYVPQQPFGATRSPKLSSTPNRSRLRNTPTRDFQLQGIVERQRSVSVSGARRNQSPSPDRRAQRSSSQDPLVHPELVTSCPTRRQDKILQQLFTLRQGLLIKQREMESHLVKVNQ